MDNYLGARQICIDRFSCGEKILGVGTTWVRV